MHNWTQRKWQLRKISEDSNPLIPKGHWVETSYIAFHTCMCPKYKSSPVSNSQCLESSEKKCWQNTPEKSKLNFSRSALFHVKTRVFLKYFVNNCHCKLFLLISRTRSLQTWVFNNFGNTKAFNHGSHQKDWFKFQDSPGFFFSGRFASKFQDFSKTFDKIPGLSKTFTELC